MVDSSIDWTTTNTAIDNWLIGSSQLFMFKIYNSQEVVWNKGISLFKHYVGNRLIANEQEYYREKLVGSNIDWATINTAFDIWLIVTSQLFLFEIYNSQEAVWKECSSLNTM